MPEILQSKRQEEYKMMYDQYGRGNEGFFRKMANKSNFRILLLVFVVFIVFVDVAILLFLFWRGQNYKDIETGKIERLSGLFVTRKIWKSQIPIEVGPPFAFKQWGFIGND